MLNFLEILIPKLDRSLGQKQNVALINYLKSTTIRDLTPSYLKPQVKSLSFQGLFGIIKQQPNRRIQWAAQVPWRWNWPATPLTFTGSLGLLQGALSSKQARGSTQLHTLTTSVKSPSFSSAAVDITNASSFYHWVHFLDSPEWRCIHPGRPGNWYQWSEQRAHSA